MQFDSIAYVSSAVRPLSDSDLEHLLAASRHHNQLHHVTGVLLYHDGSFLQYFEGPPDGVAAIYRRVRASPLHGGIIELMHRPIRARAFSEWQMGFTWAPASTVLRLANASWQARFVQGRAELDDPEGFELLSAFWRTNRNEHPASI